MTADVSTREAAPAGHCCSPRGWDHYLLPGCDKNNGSLFTVAWNPAPKSFITPVVLEPTTPHQNVFSRSSQHQCEESGLGNNSTGKI